MVAITYGVARVPGTRTADAVAEAPRQGLWARFMNAMVESRMRQAEREIRLHAHLLPPAFEVRLGDRAVKMNAEDLPFGGW